MPLLLLTFFVVYGGMHAYAYNKAQSVWQFTAGNKIALIIFMGLMVLVPILVHIQNDIGLRFMARFTAYVGYTWMGLLLLFFAVFLMADAYNFLIRFTSLIFQFDPSKSIFTGKNSFFFLIFLVLAMGCYSLFDAQRIRIEKIKIITSKLPIEVSRLTIGQISDIHLGLTVRHGLLKKIIAAIDRARPDLLVSTGDLVDAEIDHVPGLVELFQEIKPKYGKFAVTGNHDFYAGIDKAIAFTRRSGFKVLQGEGVTIDGIFNIVGVDDQAGLQMRQRNPQNEKKILSNLPQNLFTIFLKHRPVVNEDTHGHFDLQLSGHTHGGQIFPFTWIIQLMYPRQNGLYQLSDSGFLYTSTGTGTWGPPMRFLIPPKIIIIEIIKEKSATEPLREADQSYV